MNMGNLNKLAITAQEALQQTIVIASENEACLLYTSPIKSIWQTEVVFRVLLEAMRKSLHKVENLNIKSLHKVGFSQVKSLHNVE